MNRNLRFIGGFTLALTFTLGAIYFCSQGKEGWFWFGLAGLVIGGVTLTES
jgi:hypothetical protein